MKYLNAKALEQEKPQPADLRKEVTVYQLGLMLHALGIEFKDSREPTRNYFSMITHPGDFKPWSDLVDMGLAETVSGSQDDNVIFSVTERGQEFCARGF